MKFFLLCLGVIFILFLTSFNLLQADRKQKVLGAKIENEKALLLEEGRFWGEFLNNNPDYLPGWLEIGRVDKVNEINPNFLLLQP